MHLAKQFPGRCWYTYDHTYRLEAAASNSKNWSQINADLYHYHTSVVAAKPMPAQAIRYGERRGDPHSMIFCKSWNAWACSSPCKSCRFHHKCDRNGCGGAHRRIHSTEFACKCGRSPGEDPSRQRQLKELKRDGVCNLNVFSCISVANNINLPDVSGLSPINVDKLALQLCNHPDRNKVQYVLNGFRYGFLLGFNPDAVTQVS